MKKIRYKLTGVYLTEITEIDGEAISHNAAIDADTNIEEDARAVGSEMKKKRSWFGRFLKKLTTRSNES